MLADGRKLKVALNAAQSTLDKPLDPLLRDCHVADGQLVDAIDITVANTITPGEGHVQISRLVSERVMLAVAARRPGFR